MYNNICNEIKDKFKTIQNLNDKIYDLKKEIKTLNLQILKDKYDLEIHSFIKCEEDGKIVFGLIQDISKFFYEDNKITCYRIKLTGKSYYITSTTFDVDAKDLTKVSSDLKDI